VPSAVEKHGADPIVSAIPTARVELLEDAGHALLSMTPSALMPYWVNSFCISTEHEDLAELDH